MKKIETSTPSERRRTHRRTLLKTFAFFVVVPQKGAHRLPVHDLSEEGIGFDLDIEGEMIGDSPIQLGDIVDLRFYLNHSLYIPLKIQIVRVEESNQIRRIGASFSELGSPGHQACIKMLQMLDELTSAAKIDTA